MINTSKFDVLHILIKFPDLNHYSPGVTSGVTFTGKFVRDNYLLFLWFDFEIFHIIMCIIKKNCTGVCGTTPVDTQVVGDDTWHHQKFLSKSCISSVDSKSKIGDISLSIRSWEKFLGSISTLGNHTSTMRRKLVSVLRHLDHFLILFSSLKSLWQTRNQCSRAGLKLWYIRRIWFFDIGFWLWPHKMT